jgi:hypothetical protein
MPARDRAPGRDTMSAATASLAWSVSGAGRLPNEDNLQMECLSSKHPRKAAETAIVTPYSRHNCRKINPMCPAPEINF